ncbi:MAG: EAL domain-containing protein [Chromatiales bacterium]|nr:EAL domain-containing protein [Chromatiales bacterium]
MSDTITARALILDASSNRAEGYCSALRNVGIAVHAEKSANQDAFEESLDSRQGRDLLLVHTSSTSSATLPGLLKRLRLREPDAAIVVVTASTDDDETARLIESGADDVLVEDHIGRLQAVVQRELANHATRQKLRRFEVQLNEAEARCTRLIESSRDAIAYVHDGMHVLANPVYLGMFGYESFSDIEVVPVMDLVAEKDRPRFKDFLRRLDPNRRDGAEPPAIDVLAKNLAGDQFEISMSFSAATVDREPCTQIVIRDKSDSEELQRRIEEISNQDLATGLRNRHYYLRALDRAIGEFDHTSEELAVMYLQVDGFKDLRNELGIDGTDALLRELGVTLTKHLQLGDELARFSDPSLALIVRRKALYEVENLAEDLRNTVQEQMFETAGQVASLTCSIGLATASGDRGESALDLISQAQRACDDIASKGNQVKKFDPIETAEDLKNAGDRSVIETIRFALAHDRMQLVFQPMVSLQGDAKENFAVSARLLDSDGKEVNKANYIDAAARSGLMGEMDRWLITKALAALAQLRRDGRRVVFFLPLSVASISQESSLLWIVEALRDARVKGSWIVFQIEDSIIRKHLQPARKLITGLAKLRCHIALDGFGIEPNAGKILKHLPIDFACIDTSFTHNLAGSEDRQLALSEINKLAQTYKVRTIARAVEDANSLAVLWTVGVDYIQSYFLQEPSESLNYDFGTG